MTPTLVATKDVAPVRARRRKVRWYVGIAAIVASVLAGVAIAYFLTDQTFQGNNVTGGTLTVSSDGFPLDFGGENVYPTDKDNPTYTVDDDFRLSNQNQVSIDYLLSARCANCGTSTTAQQQFDDLYARVVRNDTVANGTVNTPKEVFKGRLADLKRANLGTFAAKSGTSVDTKSYTVYLWLGNRSDQEQPQNLTTTFDLVVGAITPPGSTPTPSP